MEECHPRRHADSRLIALTPQLAAEVIKLREFLTDTLDAAEKFGITGGGIEEARSFLQTKEFD